jgi:hypothetical protein
VFHSVIKATNRFILGQSSPRISEVGHENGNAKPIVIPAVLSYEGDVGLTQCEDANQLSRVFGEGQQLKAFCRGEQLAARHRSGA